MPLVAIKDKNNEFKHYEVSKEVYLYIRQLEEAIKYPKVSKIKEVYKERFK